MQSIRRRTPREIRASIRIGLVVCVGVVGNVNEAAQSRGLQEPDPQLVLADFCGKKLRPSCDFIEVQREFAQVLAGTNTWLCSLGRPWYLLTLPVVHVWVFQRSSFCKLDTGPMQGIFIKFPLHPFLHPHHRCFISVQDIQEHIFLNRRVITGCRRAGTNTW